MREGLWTDQEVQMLKILYPDCAYEVIADQIPRSILAIRRKANKLGIKKRKHRIEFTPSKIRRVLRIKENMAEIGLTAHQVSEMAGISHTLLSQIMCFCRPAKNIYLTRIENILEAQE